MNYVLNSIFVYKKKAKFFNFSRKKEQNTPVSENPTRTDTTTSTPS
jgi:hypothetical protein